MGNRINVFLGRYADPRYLKWVLFLLSLIALLLGAGAPDAPGGPGSGG